jgi:hypothetical protein
MTDPLGAQLMDGTAVSHKILEACVLRAVIFTERAGRRPCLAAVLVGSDPASVTYVKMKRNRCERVGVDSVVIELADDSTTEDVVGVIERLSRDARVDGILLQHPVPEVSTSEQHSGPLLRARMSMGSPKTPLPQCPLVCLDSLPARQGESCDFSTNTTSTWRDVTPW